MFGVAVESLSRLAAARAPVLEQCQYGRRRSAAVVAGYLMRARGLDPFEARELVAAERDIRISAALLPLLFQLQGNRAAGPARERRRPPRKAAWHGGSLASADAAAYHAGMEFEWDPEEAARNLAEPS